MAAKAIAWEMFSTYANGSTTYTAREYNKTATVHVDRDGITRIRVFSAQRTDYALQVSPSEPVAIFGVDRVLAYAAGLLRSAARPVTTRHYR